MRVCVHATTCCACCAAADDCDRCWPKSVETSRSSGRRGKQVGPARRVTGTRYRTIPLIHVIFGRGEFWDPAPAARTKILPLELFVPLAQNIMPLHVFSSDERHGTLLFTLSRLFIAMRRWHRRWLESIALDNLLIEKYTVEGAFQPFLRARLCAVVVPSLCRRCCEAIFLKLEDEEVRPSAPSFVVHEVAFVER